jgi:hypothetical protein
MNQTNPEPTPNYQPAPDDRVVVIYDDSPGDTTVRPGRPEIPKVWPRPQVPRPKPEREQQ